MTVSEMGVSVKLAPTGLTSRWVSIRGRMSTSRKLVPVGVLRIAEAQYKFTTNGITTNQILNADVLARFVKERVTGSFFPIVPES
jgi:hypothetical protein